MRERSDVRERVQQQERAQRLFAPLGHEAELERIQTNNGYFIHQTPSVPFTQAHSQAYDTLSATANAMRKLYEKEDDNVATREYTVEDFLFPGTRVIINPESDSYNHLNAIANNTAGTVLSLGAGRGDVVHMLRNRISRMARWSVRVRFDNGESMDIRHEDLLKVEAPHKNVTRYEVDGFGDLFVIEGESSEQLDLMVIKHNRHIYDKKTYDQEFVDNVLKEARR